MGRRNKTFNTFVTFIVILLFGLLSYGSYLILSQPESSKEDMTSYKAPTNTIPEIEEVRESTPSDTQPVIEIVFDESSDVDLLKTAVIDHFGDNAEVNINQKESLHARGFVTVPNVSTNKWWLAHKLGNIWEVVSEGFEYIPCEDIEGLNFTPEIVPTCWDTPTQTLINR